MNYDIQNKQEIEPNKVHVNFIDTSRHYVADGRPEYCSVSGLAGPVFSGGVDAWFALRGEGECRCSWCGSIITPPAVTPFTAQPGGQFATRAQPQQQQQHQQQQQP